MAVTERDCEAMIRGTERAGVLLMIAYRLHFERANLEAAEIVRSGRLGPPRFYQSVLSNSVTDPDNIRLSPIEQGGGTLYDIGIYCINASRYIFRSEPTEMVARSANNGEKRFRNVDEMTSAVLRFPDERLAVFTSSFAASSCSYFEVFGTKGWLRVEGAFEFAEPVKHRVTIGDRTGEEVSQARRGGPRDHLLLRVHPQRQDPGALRPGGPGRRAHHSGALSLGPDRPPGRSVGLSEEAPPNPASGDPPATGRASGAGRRRATVAKLVPRVSASPRPGLPRLF
jgi:predicted dehydrogenase